MTTSVTPFGQALRRWRTFRHLSQLELASRASTPSRHVSFLETGRARPSRDMVMRLADALEVPPAECNALLVTAGFAPHFSERPLGDDALGAVRDVMARMLRAHAPYPGLVLNAWYDVVDRNDAAARLLTAFGVCGGDAPPNLVSLLLGTLRPVVENWEEVVLDTRERLRREVADRPGDARLAALLDQVDAATRERGFRQVVPTDSPVLFTQFRTPAGPLRTISTLVHFSGARDLTVHGLHVELIYPADAAADAMLQALAVAG